MSSYKIYRSGKLRGEIVKYPDGVGCSVWYPLDDTEEFEDTGICFNFSAVDIDDMILLLQELKSAEPEIFKGVE